MSAQVGNPEDRFTHDVAHLLINDITEYLTAERLQMSRVVRKPAFCLCENKDADQLTVAFVFGTYTERQKSCTTYIFAFLFKIETVFKIFKLGFT